MNGTVYDIAYRHVPFNTLIISSSNNLGAANVIANIVATTSTNLYVLVNVQTKIVYNIYYNNEEKRGNKIIKT